LKMQGGAGWVWVSGHGRVKEFGGVAGKAKALSKKGGGV